MPLRPSVFVAALALGAAATAQVRTGADVLAAEHCERLRGRKVGLITNHTGVLADGRRTADLLHGAEGVTLVALFAPEHGADGRLDAAVADARDAATGLPVFSLYGATRTPTAAMLQGIDTLVFDVQDVGCRFYTYLATMRNGLVAAAAHGLRFVVLDRPNPLGGIALEGPVAPADRLDFVASHRVPLRHGLTAGELARMIVGEDGVRAELDVVRCDGWQRADLWADTGLRWTDPSPNLRSVTQALLYPGIGLLEGTNLSVGRGTDRPFERIGAPWCDGVALAAALRAAALPGVAFVPVRFTPTASRCAGEPCDGVDVVVTDWRTFAPVRTGTAIAVALHRLFPQQWDTAQLDWLWKHPASLAALREGRDADAITAGWQRELDLFRMRRRPFLLYE
ncbi:MAG: DUF1343 domain-containing protein [Planctomycetes bacterium]|nr:DUF1343 domain-containing protein [Planctomycetota bacterium]